MEYEYYVPDLTKPHPTQIPEGAEQRRKAVQGEHPWKPCMLQPTEWFAKSYNTEFRWPKEQL